MARKRHTAEQIIQRGKTRALPLGSQLVMEAWPKLPTAISADILTLLEKASRTESQAVAANEQKLAERSKRPDGCRIVARRTAATETCGAGRRAG